MVRNGCAVMAAAVVLATASCGDQTADDLGLPQAEHSYDGSLQPREGRYGAAGDAVDCRHGPRAGGAHRDEVYDAGATSETLAGAVETARSEGMFLELPEVDLAVAARDGDRVLLTYATQGSVKAALIFRDGRGSEGSGGDGWYRESWARCDLSEFPADVAESFFGYQVWTGADGEPALTDSVVSYPGPEHCDWQSMTFLALGERTYVRRPLAELRALLAADFADSLALPQDAVPTGYRRDGNRLWLSPSGDRAYVGRPADVEAWPRADGVACA